MQTCSSNHQLLQKEYLCKHAERNAIMIRAASCSLLIDRLGFQALPNASTKQNTIMHCTLLRYLTPQELPQDVLQHVHNICSAWTDRLQGRRIHVNALWCGPT